MKFVKLVQPLSLLSTDTSLVAPTLSFYLLRRNFRVDWLMQNQNLHIETKGAIFTKPYRLLTD